jgi:hypothetical protein
MPRNDGAKMARVCLAAAMPNVVNRMPTSLFLVPSAGSASWRGLLADPEKHWRVGYSARTLAYAWEHAKGLPPEIEDLLGKGTKLLLAIPEHKVELPGGGRPSQNDIFLLLRRGDTTMAATIEGKVEEPFGPTIAEWLTEASPGKLQRLDALCELLGLRQPLPPELRYQLLHRSASAVLEAKRFKTDEAAMIVHSFSPTARWFEDYALFVDLLGGRATVGEGYRCIAPGGMTMCYGWVKGDERFLIA